MTQRERQFRPDYGVEGPYEGGPWAVAGLAWLWAKRGAIAIVLAFLVGFVGHRMGVL
jgi:hypothetical protein